MGRKRDTVDIIKALVALCTPTVSITASLDNLDGTHTLSIPNTYWLTGGVQKIITIDSIDYRIIDFVINQSITIKPELDSDPPPTVSSFILDKPHFLHGTTEEAAVDQQKEMAANNRLPFVYLIEPLQETDIKDEGNIWGRESSPRLYFMDESIENWNPPTHKINVVEPVRQMVELFFSKIKEEEDNLYKEILECGEIAAPNWGKFVKDRGYKGKFFSDTISGLQIDFDLTMSKTACDDLIPEVECLLQAAVSTTNESILGAKDGTANSNITGESSLGNLGILWTTVDGAIPPGQETNTNLNGLSGGTYRVDATDNGIMSCISDSSGTVEDGSPFFLNALTFDGANDRVEHTQIDIAINEDFTYNMWINPKSTDLKALYTGDGPNTNALVTLNNVIRPFIDNTLYFFTLDSTVITNRWAMITVTRISGVLNVYKDGKDSVGGGQVVTSATNFDAFGDDRTPTGFGFFGTFDEISIYKGTGTTAAQALELYNDGFGKDPNTVIGTPTAYWKLNESGTDTTAIDEEGNFDGTLEDFPVSDMWVDHDSV